MALLAEAPAMTTKLYVGFKRRILPPKKGLFIHDEVPNIPLAKVFDPTKHCFNALKNIDYRKACDLVSVLMAVFPGGESTLTKEGVPDVLLEALLEKPKKLSELLDDKSNDPSYISAQRMVRRLMRSPVLKRVLCSRQNFSFKTDVVLARLNRAELGDFDALVLGLFLMAQFKGPVVVPDFGFYGREMHVSLIRENRLIAGVNTLSELPVKLRQAVLLIQEKNGSGTTYEDAEVLAMYRGLVRGTNAYNEYVRQAVA